MHLRLSSYGRHCSSTGSLQQHVIHASHGRQTQSPCSLIILPLLRDTFHHLRTSMPERDRCDGLVLSRAIPALARVVFRVLVVEGPLQFELSVLISAPQSNWHK